MAEVGRIGGAHLSPAVPIAVAAMGSFPWAQVPGYIAAQMLGAILGATLVWHAILPIPGKGSSDWEYAWIPVVAPIVGGLAGAGLYMLVGF